MTHTDKTDDFINALASRAEATPFRATRMTVLMGLALTVGLIAILILLGVRTDLAQAILIPTTIAKSLIAIAIAVIAFPAAITLARPEATPHTGWLWAVAVFAVALFGWTFLNTPQDARLGAFLGQTIGACLLSITSLSIVPITLGISMLRHGATTRPVLSGFLLGLATGGAAAAGYAIHCTEDSPMFYVSWYGAAILICGAIGALGGHRYLRW